MSEDISALKTVSNDIQLSLKKIMGCCTSTAYLPLGDEDYFIKGHKSNTLLLINGFIHEQEYLLNVYIPASINKIFMLYLYDNTNIKFDVYEKNMIGYDFKISKDKKTVELYNNTLFFFSKIGYKTGYHEWRIKCNKVHNCQACGIVSIPDSTYRNGYNMFDDLPIINKALG